MTMTPRLRKFALTAHVTSSVGFLGAAAVASFAGAPPAPGYCWYYTDPSYTQGFWDVCP